MACAEIMGARHACKQWETACKPGSVARPGCPEPYRQPFLWARTCARALATYPQAGPSRPMACHHAALAYLVLLRMEVAAFHPPAPAGLRSRYSGPGTRL